jgi:hypothetical protein
MEQTYRSQIFDHLGLVAGMCDELGIGDVIDNATQQNPDMRDGSVANLLFRAFGSL